MRTVTNWLLPPPLLVAFAVLFALSASSAPSSAKPQRKRAKQQKKAPREQPAEPPAKPPAATPEESPAAPPAAASPSDDTAGTDTSEEATDSTDAAPPELPPVQDDDAPEVDALRQAYLELRDELFRSRARAAAVASTLYSSKLRLHLDYDSARFYTVTRASVRLDGASVYDDAQGTIATDKATRWEGFVAPGRHLVSVRIEAVGKDDQRFATTLESSFVVQAVAGKDMVVRCRATDEGDIAYQWQKSETGTYKLGLDVAVDTHKRESGATAAR